MKLFDLKPNDIKDLKLKLEGKLPVDRNELLALVNSWERDSWFYIYDKDGNEVFINSYEIEKKYDLSKLDVSEITNFNSIFAYSNFNGDINSWDVSNATSMECMFYKAESFNQPLNNWNTSNVTSMTLMFYNAENFNQNLNSWNVSNVIDMNHMFHFATNFNLPLDKWNVSNVTTMYSMFAFTTNFNQNLNSWNVSNITSINSMFAYTNAFNQPLLWEISNVKDCNSMFSKAKAFEDKFNDGKTLPYETNEIKKWLIEIRSLMEAITIEENKSKDLDNFLSNLNVIDSANLNGLHNNRKIDDGKI